ncbi:hypothetical protein ACFVW2_40620, partial [Streptomyces sp. NPDC058171]
MTRCDTVARHELITRASANAKVESFAPLIRTSSATLHLPLLRERAAVNVVATDPEKSYREILDQAQAQHQTIIEAVVAHDPGRLRRGAAPHSANTPPRTPLSLSPRIAFPSTLAGAEVTGATNNTSTITGAADGIERP